MIAIGTSGFAYKEWKGSFYPEKLPQKEFLTFYAQHFKTTEINNTFYRTPSTKVVSGWMEKVPQDFLFTLKLHQKVTHHKRLKDVDENMEWFLRGSSALGERLGCILAQLPPWLGKDLDRLEAFLDQFAERAPLAFEFRHDSWFSDDTYKLLERFSQPLVIAEADDRPAVRQVTAPRLYLRLRKSEYSPQELQDWAGWLTAQKRDALVYLKHSSKAPELVSELQSLLS